MFRRFDEAVRTSEAVRQVVIALTSVFNSLGTNMEQVLRVVISFGAALIGYFSPAVLGMIGAAMMGLARSTMAFVGALSTGTAVLSTFAGFLGVLARIALAIGGATLAYNALNKETDQLARSNDSFLEKSRLWIQSVQDLGFAHKRTYDQMKADTAFRLMQVNAEIAQQEILLEAMLLGEKFKTQNRAQEIGGEPALQGRRNLFGARGRAAGLTGEMGKVESPINPLVVAMEASLKRLRDSRGELDINMKAISTMVTKDFNTGGKAAEDEKGLRAFDNWIRGIEKTMRANDSLDRQLRGMDVSNQSKAMAEAIEKADNAMASLAGMEKTRDLTKLSDALTMAGYAGENLKEQFTAMFYHGERAQQALAEMTERVKKFEDAAQRSGEMVFDLDAKLRGARSELTGTNPEERRNQEQREKAMADYRKLMSIVVIDQKGVNDAVEEFGRKWDELRSVEKQVDHIRDLRKEMDQLSDTIGNKTQRAWFDFEKQVAKVNEAASLGIVSHEKAAEMIKTINHDLYRKLWEDADEWVKKTSQLLLSLEDSAADAFAGIFTDGEFNFRALFISAAKEMTSFMWKLLVIRPIMDSLFGDLMNRGSGRTGNSGMVGEFLKGIGMKIPSMVSMGGGAAAGLGASDLGSIFANIGHQGALIGSNKQSRSVPLEVFEGAPRYHNGGKLGLGPDEVPFIGLKGERVTPAGRSSGGTINVSQTFNIEAGSGGSGDSREQATAIMEMLLPVVRRETRLVIVDQLRTGGVFDPI
jgi:hypothetical protein